MWFSDIIGSCQLLTSFKTNSNCAVLRRSTKTILGSYPTLHTLSRPCLQNLLWSATEGKVGKGSIYLKTPVTDYVPGAVCSMTHLMAVLHSLRQPISFEMLSKTKSSTKVPSFKYSITCSRKKIIADSRSS